LGDETISVVFFIDVGLKTCQQMFADLNRHAIRPTPSLGLLYESPYRIGKLLAELQEVFPERDVVLARELTKKFEEFLRGRPGELLEVTKKRALKGEFVVLVAGMSDDAE
jgi:16S rRNA C1402 (ribose-2'-O) methylase RsmI